ncbi:epoxide hydrolase family protein [Streptomyces sp. NPDC005531]|uniref:epoxide hydrolase family protein n=1 Tax=Streptomyces sp. NPDC005531 TaxID=3364722 RepID=UPI0036788489
MKNAEPFEIHVSDETLSDLYDRLQRSRWPVPEESDWQHGTSADYLHGIVSYWRDGYDWRAQEQQINRFSQWRTTTGDRLHFLMEPGSGRNPAPLLICHGWPGSITEFLDVVEPLAHPERFGGSEADAFTVVAPHLPGYGFSDAPGQHLTHRNIAARLHTLMTDVVGFDSYFVQGGDVGSGVVTWLAHDHPEAVPAVHINTVSFAPEVAADQLAEEEVAWLADYEKWRHGESAYKEVQGTRPLSLAYALTDSPLGLAAWVLDKFKAWSTPTEDGRPPFSRDRLLTNLMMHWLPGPYAPMWTYGAARNHRSLKLPDATPFSTPTGLFLCPYDIRLPPPDAWIRRIHNMVHRTDAKSGGHFAAMEIPDEFVTDVREFFRPFRT